jgi:hypothetical protein
MKYRRSLVALLSIVAFVVLPPSTLRAQQAVKPATNH